MEILPGFEGGKTKPICCVLRDAYCVYRFLQNKANLLTFGRKGPETLDSRPFGVAQGRLFAGMTAGAEKSQRDRRDMYLEKRSQFISYCVLRAACCVCGFCKTKPISRASPGNT
jgi:hypothetical protein